MKKDETTNAAEIVLRHKGAVKEAYSIAKAITGSDAVARSALTEALAALGAGGGKKRLIEEVKLKSLEKECMPEADVSYLEDVPEVAELSGESDMTRRAAVLIYGCGLSIVDTAMVLKVKPVTVKQAIKRILSCLGGKNESQKRLSLARICERDLRNNSYPPDISTLERAVDVRLKSEAEKSEIAAGGKWLISSAIAFIMLLLIGFMLWTGAVLLNYFKDSASNQIRTSEAGDAFFQGTD